MAHGINKAIIVGTLGDNPTMKATAKGDAVANISVATNESWRDKASGEKRESTEWHRVVVFGKLAEICGQYLRKGSQAYFEGKMKTRKYETNDGETKYSFEVIATEMMMLGGSQSNTAPQRAVPTPTTQPDGNTSAGGSADGFDDIPFAPIDWRAS